ncbi:9505_t:CDS:2, partial [Racocetra persica]
GGSFEGVKPFKFTNLGSMVYIGEHEAMLDLTSTNVKAKERGTFAWLFWRSAYFTMTVSLRNKIL